MSRHREGEVSIQPLKEVPEWMEAVVIRENLVRMLRCIGQLQAYRGGRKTLLVPGSATFFENRVAKLTFYQDPAEEQVGSSEDGEGDIEVDDWKEERLFVALPEVAQPFATLLAVEALWLDRSERKGEEIEVKGPRVLDPVVIYDMLREKRYLTWSVQEATEFAYSIPFVPLERGGWFDTEIVAEWREFVQCYRAHDYLGYLLAKGPEAREARQ
ncbi:hypothetical protein FAGAP_12808 [Fusarium agapanthi]|uniref:Uncharacterized protein n=1 Tax=Fusarium agapanthi TaxID=1803897 RepID=A0A9P5AWV9_9HYPO|nr:hypothetical protein FAGAP_12808 [Fusarium agapanthi]